MTPFFLISVNFTNDTNSFIAYSWGADIWNGKYILVNLTWKSKILIDAYNIILLDGGLLSGRIPSTLEEEALQHRMAAAHGYNQIGI